MLRLFTLLFALAAHASCPFSELDADATETYVRIIEHLAHTRRALDAASISEMASESTVADPFVFATTMPATAALPFRKAIDQVTKHVDWNLARERLHTLARELRGERDVRGEAARVTQSLLHFQPLPIAWESSLASVHAEMSKDGALVLSLKRHQKGLEIVRYDGQKVSNLAIESGSDDAQLLQTSGGALVAAQFFRDKLHLIDLHTEQTTRLPLPREVIEFMNAPVRYSIPSVFHYAHPSGATKLLFYWLQGNDYRFAQLHFGDAPPIKPPTERHYKIKASADGHRVYAFGTNRTTNTIYVQELVSGRELLREPSRTIADLQLEEDPRGNPRLLEFLPQRRTITDYMLHAGTRREHDFSAAPSVTPRFERDARGELGIFSGTNTEWFWWPDGSAQPMTPPRSPRADSFRFIALNDGRLMAIGFDRQKREATSVDIVTGETVKQWWPYAWGEFESVNRTPDGRWLGVIRERWDKDRITIIQIYGPP